MVSRDVALEPFTTFDSATLGGQLSVIVTTSWNTLKRDFPHLFDSYGDPSRARERVEQIQRDMVDSSQFVAMAVTVGRSSRIRQTIGVTTFIQREIPNQSGKTGPHMAIWLDPNRPDGFEHIGLEVMAKRLAFLIANSTFSGRIWTIIRPDNRASLRAWKQRYGAVIFKAIDSPHSYKEVDGITNAPRQLFTSTKLLEELRR